MTTGTAAKKPSGSASRPNPSDPSERAPLTEADRRFLVNLTEDATEMTNVAEQYPQVVERLEQLHTDWLQSIP